MQKAAPQVLPMLNGPLGVCRNYFLEEAVKLAQTAFMHPAAMRSGEKLLKYVDDGRRPDDCRAPWLLPCGREIAF